MEVVIKKSRLHDGYIFSCETLFGHFALVVGGKLNLKRALAKSGSKALKVWEFEFTAILVDNLTAKYREERKCGRILRGNTRTRKIYSSVCE